MSRAFDIIILAFLIIIIFLLATGNGDTLSRLFSSSRGTDMYQEYDKEKFNKSCLIFCIVLLIDEIILLVFSEKIPVLGLISVGVTIAAFAVFIYYIRKYARK